MYRTKQILESAHKAMHFPLGEVRQHNGEPSQAVQDMPWYYLVPKDPVNHVLWRTMIRERAAEDIPFRHAIMQACEESILFFANSICYVFEPRLPATLPLNTWTDQDDHLAWFEECWGRRDCVAAGTKVLTDSGPVLIEQITVNHRIWDGVEWVRHEGLIQQGERETICAYGIHLTGDHQVLTVEGWKDARLGIDRQEVRLPDNYGSSGREDARAYRSPGRVRLRKDSSRFPVRLNKDRTQGRYGSLQFGLYPTEKFSTNAWNGWYKVLLGLERHAPSLQEPQASCLRLLRWSRDHCLRAMGQVRELLRGYVSDLCQRLNARPDRQQFWLLTRELPLGYSSCAGQQPAFKSHRRNLSRSDDTGAGIACSGGGWQHHESTAAAQLVARQNPRANARKQEVRQTFDLYNCGPRHRFTVIGDNGTATIVSNCGVEKARDLSLSWNGLVLFYKHWLTEPLSKMGLVSLTEDKVDSVEDSDSMMWKLDFLHSWLPDWWRLHGGKDILERGSYNHKFHNRLNKSTITGYACTGNVARGGRKIAMLMDEFAEWPINAQQMALDSTQYAVKSRYVVSTFTSDSDRFFQIMRREQSTMLKIICDWKDNPEKKVGLYTSIGGHLKVLDRDYIYPADYPYILDGKIRSPYYDEACTRLGSNPQSIARELDRDPQGVSSKIFSAAVLQKARETCKPPYHKGNLDFTPGIYEPIWMGDHQGLFSIWKDLNPETGKLGWGGPYAIGCDIAHGSGSSVASNSALEVFDIASGEQVIEYYSNKINPVDFAQLVFTTCKWLCQGNDLSWAYLNFENNGEPGHAFGAEIVRLGWSNLYYTQKESVLYKQRSDKIGHHNQDGGYGILSEMQRAIQQDECVLHSETTVFECGQYEMGGAGRLSGKCIHVGSRASGDPTSQGKSHGDCAIAAGLAWMARCDRPVEKAEGFVEEGAENNAFAEFERKFGKRRLSMARRGGESFDNFRNVG